MVEHRKSPSERGENALMDGQDIALTEDEVEASVPATLRPGECSWHHGESGYLKS